MILGSECIRLMTKKSNDENDISCEVTMHRHKSHRIDPKKLASLKQQVLQVMTSFYDDDAKNDSIVALIRDDIALNVVQLQAMMGFYNGLDCDDQSAMRKVIKLNLRTKEEKRHLMDLNENEQAFIWLFMSEDQRKRYRESMVCGVVN